MIEKDGNIEAGVFFCLSGGEYACYDFDYSFFKETGKIKLIFIYTDILEIEEVVLTITNDHHQTIDVFENKCLCDSFLITLKYLMLRGEFDDETKSKVNDWYFSDSPKYKILD